MTRILAVDDSPSMRMLVASTLSDAGFSVVQACDGVEALEKAQTESVDLVLADVNMPRMDGLTLVEKLREVADYKYTPILILTTESELEKKQRAKAAGATGWLVKPFDPGVLVSTIKRVVG